MNNALVKTCSKSTVSALTDLNKHFYEGAYAIYSGNAFYPLSIYLPNKLGVRFFGRIQDRILISDLHDQRNGKFGIGFPGTQFLLLGLKMSSLDAFSWFSGCNIDVKLD